MKCPNCNETVVTFGEWYSGKCYKVDCSHCQKHLVASKGTKVSIMILMLMGIAGAAVIMFTQAETFVQRDKALIAYFLMYGVLFVIPTGYVLYKRLCGYVVAGET